MFAYKHEETKIRSPEKRPMTVTVPRFKMCFQNSLARWLPGTPRHLLWR